MSRLGDLLELMYTAHSRVTSVHAVFREWVDVGLWQEAAVRWAQMEPRGSRVVITALGSQDRGEAEESVHRVWHVSDGPRWRVESDEGRRTSVTVLYGARYWHKSMEAGPVTNVRRDGSIADNVGSGLPSRFIELLFDPASLLSSTSIEVDGDTWLAGRPAMQARARWRPGISLIDIEWPYADELRLDVDAEYGVLLRFEAALDGKPFIRWQVEEIAFDESLEESLFDGIAGAVFPAEADLGRRTPPTNDSAEVQRLLDEFWAMGDEEGDA